MKLFWADEKRNTFKTYDDLIFDLNSKRIQKKYIRYEDPYLIYLEIIYNMILGSEVVLLDNDYSQKEIENLEINYNTISKEFYTEGLNIASYEDLLKKIEDKKDNCKLVIYTSGTTGQPKKVIHNFNTMTRNVKRDSKFLDNTWGFCFNPTHFAGLQVFFQAFLNGNALINLFDIDRKRVEYLCIKYKVTNLSATPTYYRTLMPYCNVQNDTIKKITLGGERYDPSLEKKLGYYFPHAKIVNIYASTEAGSLLGAEGEVFSIPIELNKLIKLTDDKEILIHKSLLGSIEEAQPSEWYYTGDIVEIISENKFKIISRKSEIINIGGYKVNPHEVENQIMQLKGVLDVTVKARANKITGNILVADIVKQEELDSIEFERYISENLKSSLQSWKVPRIIKFVDCLDSTRTGKKVRI